MERRNDFHDNNSIRERNEGSWNMKEGVTAVNLEGFGGEQATEYNQNIKTRKPDYCL